MYPKKINSKNHPKLVAVVAQKKEQTLTTKFPCAKISITNVNQFISQFVVVGDPNLRCISVVFCCSGERESERAFKQTEKS